MVTTAEAERLVEERERQISSLEKRYTEMQAPKGTIKTQLALSQQVGKGGVSQRLSEIRQQYRTTKRTGLEQLRQARKSLTPVKQQIAQAKAEQEAYESLQTDIRVAQAFAGRPEAYINLTGRQRELAISYTKLQEAQELATQQEATIRSLGLTPVYSQGVLTGFESESLQMSIPLQELPTALPSAIPKLQEAGIISVQGTSTIQEGIPTLEKEVVGTFKIDGKEIPEINYYIVEPSGERRLAEQSEIQKVLVASEEKAPFGQVLSTDVLRVSSGVGAFKLGALSTATGFSSAFVDLGKALVSPIETSKGVYQSIKSPISSVQSIQTSISETFQTNPSYAIGRGLGEYAIIKSPTLITKGSDYLRTMNLKQVSTTEIIAPEYFAGQTYPRIAKGQTAGQLLQEFKVQEFGYTATPKPFKATTTALKGSSELPGVYQAPKLSPKFLGVSGESKVFSLRITDTLRPTAIKIYPESFQLTPGISYSQKTLGSYSSAKTFFQSAPKGKSFVPFIKYEKESVIPYGSILQKTGKSTFFEFEGRKIPIFEYKTLGGTTTKIPTTQKITQSTISSSRVVVSRGKITPLELVSVSKSLPKSSSFSSSVTYKPIPSSSLSPMISYSKVSYPSKPPKSSGFAPSKSTSIISSKGFSGISKPPSISSGSYGITPPRVSYPKTYVPRQTTRRRTGEKRKRTKSGFTTPIRPSFTASALDLKGVFPKTTQIKGVDIGILPSQLRVLPYKKKRKKKKR